MAGARIKDGIAGFGDELRTNADRKVWWMVASPLSADGLTRAGIRSLNR